MDSVERLSVGCGETVWSVGKLSVGCGGLDMEVYLMVVGRLSRGRGKAVRRVLGGCLDGVWKLSGDCGKLVWWVWEVVWRVWGGY